MTNMKKYYSILLMALVAIVGLASCSDSDGEGYTPAGAPSGAQVFFANDLPSSRNLSFDETTFTIPINRYVTDGALTVDLTHTDNTGFYTIPSSVTFAAGESEAIITVTYDAASMEYNEYIPDTISIASEGNITPYGASSYAFSAGAALTWKSLGTGKYIDDWFGYSGSAEILQCEQQPNKFRVVAPYAGFDGDGYFDMSGEMDDYLELTIMQPGNALNGVNITRSDLVYFPDYSTGAIHPTYADVVNLLHPSRFASYTDEEVGAYNRVLEFDENGQPTRIQLAPYYYMFSVGGWNYTQYDDIIQIYFPGNDPKDYSLEVTYTGKFINVADEYFAMFTLAMGADVEEVKYAIVPATDVDATVSGIAEGTMASYSATADGSYQLPVSETGRFAVVAVAFAKGEAVASTSTSFKFEIGAPEVWNSLGIGFYTEDVLCELYGAPAVTYEVEIEESQDRPGVYRLVNAYGENFPYNDPGDWDDSKDYYIEINAQDPNGVFIEQQSSGLNWGDGEFVIQSLGSYYVDNGYDFDTVKAAGFFGALADGVITFPEGGLLGTLIGYGGPYQLNSEGDAKIVLPSAVSSVSAAHVASNKNNKFSHRKFRPNSSKILKKYNQTILSKESMKLVR